MRGLSFEIGKRDKPDLILTKGIYSSHSSLHDALLLFYCPVISLARQSRVYFDLSPGYILTCHQGIFWPVTRGIFWPVTRVYFDLSPRVYFDLSPGIYFDLSPGYILTCHQGIFWPVTRGIFWPVTRVYFDLSPGIFWPGTRVYFDLSPGYILTCHQGIFWPVTRGIFWPVTSVYFDLSPGYILTCYQGIFWPVTKGIFWPVTRDIFWPVTRVYFDLSPWVYFDLAPGVFDYCITDKTGKFVFKAFMTTERLCCSSPRDVSLTDIPGGILVYRSHNYIGLNRVSVWHIKLVFCPLKFLQAVEFWRWILTLRKVKV